MRIGQTATITKTGATGEIEKIEDKKNGTWVTINGKSYRDSAIVIDWTKPLTRTETEMQPGGLLDWPDPEYGEQDLTGVIDDATETLIQQIGKNAGLIDDPLNENPTDDEIEADGKTKVIYDGGLRIEGPAENLPATCECGCRGVVNKGSIYLQGHDQRHKGILIRAAVAGDDNALTLLIRKGWRTRSEIVARREDLAAKEARAAQPKQTKTKNKPERAVVLAQ